MVLLGSVIVAVAVAVAVDPLDEAAINKDV